MWSRSGEECVLREETRVVWWAKRAEEGYPSNWKSWAHDCMGLSLGIVCCRVLEVILLCCLRQKGICREQPFLLHLWKYIDFIYLSFNV